jgi:hypothetical protein
LALRPIRVPDVRRLHTLKIATINRPLCLVLGAPAVDLRSRAAHIGRP